MFAINDQGQVTFNGKPVEEMTEEEKKAAYGSAGNVRLGEIQTFDFSAGNRMPNVDRRYFEEYEINLGDAGTTTGYRLKPEYERMQGMAQVGAPRSVGGQGEPIDPSLITYDEEFGYITPITNIKPPDSTFLQEFLPYIAAAGTLAAIGAVGGFSGLGIAGAGEGAAAAGGGTTSGAGGIVGGATETVAAGTGAAGTGAGGGSIFPAGAGIGTGGPLLETAALATTVPASTQAMANASALLSNLTPTSQRIIASAVGQAVSAISASRRQTEAQRFASEQQDIAAQRRQEETERQRQFEREQEDIAEQRRREKEDREREERRIRGTPQAYTFNITPRNRTGIIGSGMGG